MLLLAGASPAVAQDTQLKGLAGVRVVVTWAGAEADRGAIQTDVELRLRQAGIRVLTEPEQAQTPGHPVLFIGIGAIGPVIPVAIELGERVWLERESKADAAALAARLKQPNASIDEAFANSQTPLRDATIWRRCGVAQAEQPESVKDIIARYEKKYVMTNQGVQHMLDLEVQAALAGAHRAASIGTVRESVNAWVDEFLNAWLAVNPKGSGQVPVALGGQLKAPAVETSASPAANELSGTPLSELKPGVARDVALARLASQYTLTKLDQKTDSGFEVWFAQSKAGPHESAEVSFVGGKTYSVKLNLFGSDSPFAAKLVSALHSAIYNSTTAPSESDAAAAARSMAGRLGRNPEVCETEAASKVQMALWKFNNARFGPAQIGASQSVGPTGDLQELSIALGGRSFQISLFNIDGRTSVSLSEFR
jgi:hypothetical protein